MTARVTAFVALGSNLGDRGAHLEGALRGLRATPGVALAAVSDAFENPPVGGPPQDAYWNAVAEVVTTLAPEALLARLHALEDAAGRTRAERDGPRTLDLDLLLHGDAVRPAAPPVLPHPRATDRAFTLRPWAEIAPLARVAGTGRTVLEHEAALRAVERGAFEGFSRVARLDPGPAPGAATPRVLRDLGALRAFRDAARGRVAFTPTMGALHEGHAANVRRARASADVVVASVFVNPLQFAPGEDLARYPRTFDADLALLAREGADAVYAPEPGDLYPPGFSTSVDVGGPAAGFEGAARPGHFRGVATVVAKLLARVRPDVAWFGRKDAQQNAVVARLVRDLDLPVAIEVAPTIRDLDGLALSSRNRYLAPADRRRALALPRALAAARAAAAAGERDGATLARTAADAMARVHGVEVEYAALVGPEDFAPRARLGGGPALLVAAVRVGSTRLLDNLWITAP